MGANYNDGLVLTCRMVLSVVLFYFLKRSYLQTKDIRNFSASLSAHPWIAHG